MEGQTWRVLRIDEVEPIAVAGVLWRPLRRTLGVQAFGINAYSAREAGEHVVEPHTEEALGHEEVYLVLTGRATFTLDGESLAAPAGAVVHIPDPTVRREAHADVPGTTVIAIGGPRGEPYTPSAWEAYFAVERFRATGAYDEAVAELEEALVRHPGNPGIEYALGCWHALAGHAEEALAHVRRAIELEPRYAAWAQDDEDLVTIRAQLPAAPADA